MNDQHWMQYAITLAKKAQQYDEVPVGAVIVKDNKIIGEGFNQPISSQDPTAHAEIIALRQAAKNTGNYRLIDTTLYVTIEPCVMCIGALIHARVKRLVFGANEPKAGAAISQFQLANHPTLNHQLTIEHGICQQQCSELIQQFFRHKRL